MIDFWSTAMWISGGTLLTAYLIRKNREKGFGVHDSTNEEDVKDKIVVITGGNSGLGKEASFEMAKRNAKVVIASRNLELSKEVAKEILQETGNREIFPMSLDLASSSSIKKFVKDLRQKFDKIHILINNAGVVVPLSKKMKTEDGFEYNFGVNHLGTFSLTMQLLEPIKNAAPSRIIIVASSLAESGTINLDDLMMESVEEEKRMGAYSNSKLANLYFTRELANKIGGNGIQVYGLCPGWVKTNLARYMDLTWKSYILMLPFAFLFMRSPHQGVQTILHCALSRSSANETGKLYRNCALWKTKIKFNDKTAQQLWETSEKLTGEKLPKGF